MSTDAQTSFVFLTEIERQTKGDMHSQISMYEVGASLGYTKNEAGALAEALMVSGLVELRTLAGAISITPEGLKALGKSVPSDASASAELHFSAGPILNDADRQMLQDLITEIKKDHTSTNIPFTTLEEIVFDLKTIEVHLLSPRPKVAVCREILRGLADILTGIGRKNITEKLTTLLH